MHFAAALRHHLKPRRIGAVVAILGLLFAATVASITHSIAMPMMAGIMSDAVHRAMTAETHAAGHASTHAAEHDCGGAMAADEVPASPDAPCEQGCLLCKSCSLASAIVAGPPSIETRSRYYDYQSTAYLPLAGITPSPLNEPPRI